VIFLVLKFNLLMAASTSIIKVISFFAARRYTSAAYAVMRCHHHHHHHFSLLKADKTQRCVSVRLSVTFVHLQFSLNRRIANHSRFSIPKFGNIPTETA